MDILLWVVQGLLVVVFLMAGGMKLTQPKEKLAGNMGWVEDFSANQVKGIGALELLGALGVILPWAFGILPILTPLAALGLGLVMLGAGYTHIRRNEYPMLAMNLILFAMAVFVAYGRYFL